MGGGVDPPAKQTTPAKVLVALLSLLIVAHLAEELATTAAAHLPTSWRFLIGCLALVAVLGPALYRFAYRPLARRIQAQQAVARQLGLVNERLGAEVVERQRVSEELQRERDQLKSILDAMEDAVCIVTRDHGVAYANPVGEAAFGPLDGRPCYTYFHSRDAPCPDCRNDEVFAGNTLKWEWEPPGGGRVYDILDTPLRLPGGQVAKLEILHDVTAHRKSERLLRTSREELRALAAHLSGVREEERARAARQIHDDTSQVLAALKMEIGSALMRVKAEEPVADLHWDHVDGLIDRVSDAVQRIGTELRPGVLDDLGVCAAVEWQAARFYERESIPCSVTCEGVLDDLPREVSTALFRGFQEALDNVGRHASASWVEARLERKDGVVILTVWDDGRGITEEDRTRPGAFGLLALREKALALGGDLTVEGVPGRGTTLTVWVPVDGAPEAEGREGHGNS